MSNDKSEKIILENVGVVIQEIPHTDLAALEDLLIKYPLIQALANGEFFADSFTDKI